MSLTPGEPAGANLDVRTGLRLSKFEHSAVRNSSVRRAGREWGSRRRALTVNRAQTTISPTAYRDNIDFAPHERPGLGWEIRW
jgi:hypothetical protein